MEREKTPRWKCNLCKKNLKSKKALEYHLQHAKIPCNLKCRTCGHVAKNKSDYQYHQNLHSQSMQPVDIRKMPRAELEQKYENMQLQMQLREEKERHEAEMKIKDEKIRSLLARESSRDPAAAKEFEKIEEIIPFQDFGTVTNNDSTTEDDNYVSRVIIRETRTREIIIERKRRARAVVTPDMMNIAIEALTIPEKDTNLIAENMMCHIVASPDTRLHNIYLEDVGTIRIWSRNPLNGVCEWTVYSANLSTKMLHDYAQTMLSFLVETGVELLVPAMYKTDYCLALNGMTRNEKPILSFIWYKDRKGLQHEWPVYTSELTFLAEKRDPSLIDMIHARIETVLKRKKMLLLNDSSLKAFMLKKQSTRVSPDHQKKV